MAVLVADQGSHGLCVGKQYGSLLVADKGPMAPSSLLYNYLVLGKIIGTSLMAMCLMTFTQPEWNTTLHEACQHQ